MERKELLFIVHDTQTALGNLIQHLQRDHLRIDQDVLKKHAPNFFGKVEFMKTAIKTVITDETYSG